MFYFRLNLHDPYIDKMFSKSPHYVKIGFYVSLISNSHSKIVGLGTSSKSTEREGEKAESTCTQRVLVS